jgi:hypothetical protein
VLHAHPPNLQCYHPAFLTHLLGSCIRGFATNRRAAQAAADAKLASRLAELAADDGAEAAERVRVPSPHCFLPFACRVS